MLFIIQKYNATHLDTDSLCVTVSCLIVHQVDLFKNEILHTLLFGFVRVKSVVLVQEIVHHRYNT